MVQLCRLADLIAPSAQTAIGTTQSAPRNSSLVERPRVSKTLRDLAAERGRAEIGVEQAKRLCKT